MPEFNTNIDKLIIKYLQQELSDEEQSALEQWLTASIENREQFELLTDQQYISGELEKLYGYDGEKGWKSLKSSLDFPKQPLVRNIFKGVGKANWIKRWKIREAAILILLAGCGYLFLTIQHPKSNSERVVKTGERFKNDFLPGGNKAVLTLANDSTIVLDDVSNGALIEQGNTKVLKFNGKLSYKSSNLSVNKILYNTISTPRGGQYQIILPDGSAVWLNAESSMRFPTAFAGKERRVEITGEAYFEVAPDKAAPFIVFAEGAQIKVLGTHFDVMAYRDEAMLKTTLLEGSVQFMNGNLHAQIEPGQQCQLTKTGQIKVENNIDISEVMAWKNGFFYFQRADLQTVMRQISRWYNVDVVYSNKKTGELFHAEIPRNTKLSEVLKALEIASGIRFTIENQKVIVL